MFYQDAPPEYLELIRLKTNLKINKESFCDCSDIKVTDLIYASEVLKFDIDPANIQSSLIYNAKCDNIFDDLILALTSNN